MTFALGLLGFAMLPMRHKQRRRASILAAAGLLMMVTTLSGCGGGGGSSNGAVGQSLNASTQKVVALDVSVNGAPQPVANLPISLGTVTKQ